MCIIHYVHYTLCTCTFVLVYVLVYVSGRANMSYPKPLKNRMPKDDVTISNEVNTIYI